MPALQTAPNTPDAFNQLLADVRPRLHRYCARITGSVIDGEDVVQEAMVKALEAFPRARDISDPQAWLFRIAHNAALDFLRRQNRLMASRADADPDTLEDPGPGAPPVAVDASLRRFAELPVLQRGTVILMDVLGYSLEEIAGILESSVPAVKAALHRGRTRLRDLAREPETRKPPALSDQERTLLATYVERFNARDFDAVRAMLADEVRLELVNRHGIQGRKDVQVYFTKYSALPGGVHLSIGWVEGRPAILMSNPANPAVLMNFVFLTWQNGQILGIRDFFFAGYATEGAEVVCAE